MRNGAIVSVDRLHFAFASQQDRERAPLFRSFSLAVPRLETLVLMGASGVGKSTLGRLLAQHLTPHGGRIRYGCEIQRPCDIAYADQTPLNVVFPWQTVVQNLDYPLRKFGWSQQERNDRVARLLALFRLDSLAHAFPVQISGGELQRLALARILAWRPKLVVLDEALGALDLETRSAVLTALRRLAGEDGITLVSISHSISDALSLGDHCVVLAGRPVQIAYAFDVQDKTLSDATLQDQMVHAIRDAQL